MAEDNERDRLVHGFDAGVIVDGEVVYDEGKGRYILMDDEGDTFDPQEALGALNGQKMRLTIVSFDAMVKMEEMMKKTEDEEQSTILTVPRDEKLN